MSTPPDQAPTWLDISNDLKALKADGEKFNNIFSNYQQATQWVVQFAFTSIASATLTVMAPKQQP